MGLPRTSPDSVLFSTYNVLNLFEDASAAGREHYAVIVEVILGLGADVLAVQEIRGPDGRSARAGLRRRHRPDRAGHRTARHSRRAALAGRD